MQHRRTTWSEAIRLAGILSVLAVAVAAILHTLGLSQPVIVLGVIVVGFATSWVRTGHVDRYEQGVPRHGIQHRVVTVPVRSVHHPVS